MGYYIGLDVSQRQTAVCIIDEAGERLKEGKTLTQPTAIADWVSRQIDLGQVWAVGLEAGSLSAWLYNGLSKLNLPVVCLETFQAHQFLKTNRNKTDQNDARGLAQLLRMGPSYYKSVTIRSEQNQAARTLLTLRDHLVRQKVGLENNITGSLKPFGLVVPRSQSTRVLRERILIALVAAEERGINLRDYVLPLVETYDSVCSQLIILTRQAEKFAKENPICKRLMTAPGVGPIVALSFMTAVDAPERFTGSEDIGAYFGLTPKQYQSGETDIRGGISGRGSTMTRTHLVQAATVLLINKKWSKLKAWGIKISKRSGFNKARIAVARKLSIILHRMWVNEENFRWTSAEETILAA